MLESKSGCSGRDSPNCTLTSQVKDCALGKHCAGYASFAWCACAGCACSSLQLWYVNSTCCSSFTQGDFASYLKGTVGKFRINWDPLFLQRFALVFCQFFRFVSLLHLEFLQDTVIGATAMIEDQRALGFIPQDVNGTRGLGYSGYSTPFRKDWICSPWSLKPHQLSNLPKELWSECFEEAQRISSRQLLNSSELEKSTLSSEAALAGA